MSQDWIDEAEELLDLLTSVAASVDPVPADVVEAAIGCFRWRSLEAELAELMFDSERGCDQLVGVRAQATSRQLTFEARDLLVELEFDLAGRPQLVGQLVPPCPADIEIRSPGASVIKVQADQFGRFWADRIDGNAMSLRIRPNGRDGKPADTPWVTIESAEGQ